MRLCQGEDPAAATDRLIEEYLRSLHNPYAAAARGYLDDVNRSSVHPPAPYDALRMLSGEGGTEPVEEHGTFPVLP